MIYIINNFYKTKNIEFNFSIEMDFFNAMIEMKLRHSILTSFEFSKMLDLINLICSDYSCFVLNISKINYFNSV